MFLLTPLRKFRDWEIPERLLIENYVADKNLIKSIIALSCLAIFFFGYDQGMMSGVNNSPEYVGRMKIGYWDESGAVTVTDSTKQGGIVAIYYLGTLVGAIFGGYVSDEVGRIKSIGLGTIIAIVGAIVQGCSRDTPMMCGTRFFTGIGTGILNAVVPVYSSECASHLSRGAAIALEFTLNIFGVCLAYWLAYGLSYIGILSQFRWRFPIFFQIIPLAFLVAIVWFFPESPRYLIKSGKYDRAKKLLIQLRGEDGGQREFEEIIAAFDYEKDSALSTNYVRMFFDWYSGSKEAIKKAKKLHIARRIQLVIWLQIMQEWTGIAGITVYQTDIFTQAGYSSGKSQWLAAVNNTIYTLSTVLAIYTIDRFGRRFANFWGLGSMGVCMFLAGGLSKAQQLHPDNKNFGAAATAFVFLFTAIFGATLLMTPWILPSEVFPLKLRAAGNAMGVVGWSIGNGWLMLMSPIMFNAIHEKTLYIFGACNFLTIVMVYFLYPETANRSLEDIDFLFASESWLVSKCEAEFAKIIAERHELLNQAHEMTNDMKAEAKYVEQTSDAESTDNAET